MQRLLILGRQPALGVAELESLYGAASVRPFSDQAALVDVPVEFGRLGGSVKLAMVIQTLPSSDWKGVDSYMLKHADELVEADTEGKLQVGLSAYGFRETAQRVNASGLSLKKALRKSGYSVRLIPNQEPALNSAQVFHNHLTGGKGIEIIAITDGQQTIIARTAAVQDIDSYTIRDRSRPKRDARVGMLPPKLAQTIINLAGKHIVPEGATLISVDNPRFARLLDPFCGTGVLLQEALLMGYDAYGTDLEQRMIDYSQANLEWLAENFQINRTFSLEAGDATSHKWQQPVDLVACETYLGKPFTSTPDPAILASAVGDCNLIITKFLKNIRNQIKPGTRLCVAVPAWQIRPNQFKHLPLIDQISDMGYNRIRFEHVRDSQLLYYREDQIVARELLVLQKI